jgi:hypothetical protein
VYWEGKVYYYIYTLLVLLFIEKKGIFSRSVAATGSVSVSMGCVFREVWVSRVGAVVIREVWVSGVGAVVFREVWVSGVR